MSGGASGAVHRVSSWRPLMVAACGLLSWVSVAMADIPYNPQQYDLAFAKGVLKFNQGKYAEAQTFFGQALDAKPGDQEASYYLGQALLRTKKYAEAEDMFRVILTTDASSGRATLGLAIAQFYQEKYQEALDSLTAAASLLPDDPLVYYFQGLTQNRLRAYEHASDPLNRALLLSPELAPESHYQLGIAEYGRGRYGEAKGEFEAVVAAEPASEVARAARLYLMELRDPAQGIERRRMDPTQPKTIYPPVPMQKSWDLLFSVSPQYDSNVVLLPLGVQPPGGETGITRQSDVRTVFTARGEYRPLQTDTWTVGTAYAIYQSFHQRLHGFDVQNHTPSVFVQHRFGRFQSRIDYLYDDVSVGRLPFLVSHAIRPVFSLREGDRWFTQLQLGYQNKDFKSDRFELNDTRDARNWMVGLHQFLHFGDNAGVLRVGYIYDTDRTGGGSPTVATVPSNADWAYTGHRFSTGLRLPPIWTVIPDLTFDYYRQNYDNPNAFSLDGRTVRRDDIYIFTAALSRPITKHLSFGLQYSYTRDRANVAVFDYERSVYSLSLSGSF